MERRRRKIIKENLKDFKWLVEEFSDFISADKPDTIYSVLDDLCRRRGIKDFQDFSLLRIYFVGFITSHFLKIFERLFLDEKGFLLCFEMFRDIVWGYNEVYVCEPVKKLRRIGREKIPEELKEKYNTYRISYIRFIKDYQNFIKRLNKQLGEDLIRVPYIETPGEL